MLNNYAGISMMSMMTMMPMMPMMPMMTMTTVMARIIAESLSSETLIYIIEALVYPMIKTISKRCSIALLVIEMSSCELSDARLSLQWYKNSDGVLHSIGLSDQMKKVIAAGYNLGGLRNDTV